MKLRISKNFKIKASLEHVPELIDWVRAALLEMKVPQKEVYKVCLPLEDILVMMINKAETEAKIKLNIEKFSSFLDYGRELGYDRNYFLYQPLKRMLPAVYPD